LSATKPRAILTAASGISLSLNPGQLRERDVVIASQRVRPEVAGPMTSSAKQSRLFEAFWIASSLSLLAMTIRQL
jgi:hypothetical protein